MKISFASMKVFIEKCWIIIQNTKNFFSLETSKPVATHNVNTFDGINEGTNEMLWNDGNIPNLDSVYGQETSNYENGFDEMLHSSWLGNGYGFPTGDGTYKNF